VTPPPPPISVVLATPEQPPALFKLKLLPQFCTVRRCKAASYTFDIISRPEFASFSHRCYCVQSASHVIPQWFLFWRLCSC